MSSVGSQSDLVQDIHVGFFDENNAMLGNCVLRNPNYGQGVFDKGALCEALLFFTKVHLFIDSALAIRALAGYFGNMTFSRITIDPAVCTGKPCIRGLRFPVARLLGLMAAGETREAILKAYPYLESGDIDEALRYAAFLAEDETIELQPSPAK
jgi:uncharacterized protein (DUF433 family)